MTQLFLRPSADVSDGNWTDASNGTTLFSSLDESSLDDADYIKSGINPVADACKLELTDPSGDWEEPVTLRVRFRKDGDAEANHTVRLLQNNNPTTTFNGSDKTANITLSGGDLIATVTSTAAAGVRSVASHSSGKKYAEIEMTSGDPFFVRIGFANSTYAFTTTFGQDNNGFSWGAASGAAVLNNSTIAFIDGYSTGGETACMAIDFDNEKFWARPASDPQWNNDVLANENPATNTGGINFASMAAGPYFLVFWNNTSTGHAVTLNTGMTPYVGTKPAGFSNWSAGGELEIAEWIYADIADTFVTEEETLTTPQFEAITDPSDLRIEFDATVVYVPMLDFSDKRNSQYLAALEDF